MDKPSFDVMPSEVADVDHFQFLTTTTMMSLLGRDMFIFQISLNTFSRVELVCISDILKYILKSGTELKEKHLKIFVIDPFGVFENSL